MVQIDIDNINLKGHINGAKTIIKSKLNNEFKMEDDGYKIDASERGQGYAILLLCNIINAKYGIDLDYTKYEIHHKDFNTSNNHIQNLLLVNKKIHDKLHSENIELAMKALLSKYPQLLKTKTNKQKYYYPRKLTSYEVNEYGETEEKLKSIFNIDSMDDEMQEELALMYIEISFNNSFMYGDKYNCIDLYNVIV